MALHSADVEYTAANTASCEAIWLHKLIADLTNEMLELNMLYFDI